MNYNSYSTDEKLERLEKLSYSLYNASDPIISLRIYMEMKKLIALVRDDLDRREQVRN